MEAISKRKLTRLPRRGDIFEQHGVKTIVLSVDDTWETKEDKQGLLRRRRLNRWVCVTSDDGWVNDHLMNRFVEWVNADDVSYLGNSEKTADAFDNYFTSVARG